jgi:integrase
MTAGHLELLVEEPSMEAFLRVLLPRLLPQDCSFEVHPFQGKHDLLGKLESRLRGYAHWLPDDWRIVVVVDRDDDDCQVLKQRLEEMAAAAGLRTRSCAKAGPWQVVNRIAIEELEAWYFGDWAAVCSAYPRVSRTIPAQKRYREPDAIRGGTWEAFQRILKRYGHYETGLRKIEAARILGAHFDPGRCRSHSFLKFHEAIIEATV